MITGTGYGAIVALIIVCLVIGLCTWYFGWAFALCAAAIVAVAMLLAAPD